MQTTISPKKIYYFPLLFLMLVGGIFHSYSQCPSVTEPLQSFCNISAPLVLDLVANDNGGGVRWYDSASSIIPLPNNTPLINGSTYYAGDTTGVCVARENVTVSIIGPPFGLNFQGICVDDPNDANISDLFVIGNDVQYYNVPTGGTPLPPSTILIDNTFYYADQANPITGCRTSRLTIFVNVVVVPVPTGDSVQEFCDDPANISTIADLVASGTNNWYTSPSSATPLDPTTPIVNGETYYASTVISPCESIGRLEVKVVFTPQNDPGIDGTIDICETDIITTPTVDLFSVLNGTPQNDGIWTGPFSTTNGYLGLVDITGMTVEGSPYVFTYTVNSSVLCSSESSTVSVVIVETPNAGLDSTLDVCSNSGPVDLFTILGGNPDSGGTWNPALSSGTGVFDPAVDPAGVYTYAITSSCGNDGATVTVNVNQASNAGVNAVVDLCENDSSVDLFTILGGNPDSGGTWNPALSSGTGIFDPAIDSSGIYTYTITSPCGNDSATVTVNVNQAPNAGSDAVVDLCDTDSPVDLFTVLSGNPDSGGTWNPALSSGTGVFDPTVDPAGVYTYTVTSPCGNDNATVTVNLNPVRNAGIDGILDLCVNATPVDLFTVLGGNPDSGGTWNPALSSGTGVFDPAVDFPVIYIYTVTSPCGNDSATVTVNVNQTPNAGIDAVVDLCNTDSPVDLFTVLGGNPDSGGIWNPALSSGTGVFDPAVDSPGIYIYTITSPCGNDSATVTVNINPAPNAGIDEILDLCENDSPVDLFTILGGNPDSGGSWDPALSSGTGVFDPAVDPAGVYTYAITSPCGNDSATVTVNINPAPNAGVDAVVDLCNTDSPVDLFTILGGNPDSGGTWNPALSGGNNIFDPAIDSAGIYIYTVTSPCGNDSATVTVNVNQVPNAGVDAVVDLCENDSSVDLFTILGGNPDTGGIWSPALSSGTGVFDPAVDIPGIYTYTVSGVSICGGSDSARVTVTLFSVSDVTGAVMTSNDPICLNDPNDVEISGADFLSDGLYTLTYELTGANLSVNSINVAFLNGNTIFTIPPTQLSNSGPTTATINELFLIGNMCGADVSSIAPIQFLIETGPTPQLISEGNEFCISDNPTIADLSANIIDPSSIQWYDSPINGNPYPETLPLVDGETYYGSTLSINGCDSGLRLEVIVSVIDCHPVVIVPDGFSPNGDGINDAFAIKNLRELYPNFTLEIYNRYGNVIYKGNRDIPDWDGSSNTGMRMGSSELPVGVYFYILNFNKNGKDPVQGRVYLSR